MAFTPYHNIDGSNGVDVELVAPGSNANNIKSIMITNTHATADATVSLFISKLSANSTAAEVYYIISTVAIPSDTSLLLDDQYILAFDNTSSAYGLYTTVGSSDTLDIIIKR